MIKEAFWRIEDSDIISCFHFKTPMLKKRKKINQVRIHEPNEIILRRFVHTNQVEFLLERLKIQALNVNLV
jgi:hypothetical protein